MRAVFSFPLLSHTFSRGFLIPENQDDSPFPLSIPSHIVLLSSYVHGSSPKGNCPSVRSSVFEASGRAGVVSAAAHGLARKGRRKREVIKNSVSGRMFFFPRDFFSRLPKAREDIWGGRRKRKKRRFSPILLLPLALGCFGTP